MNRDFEKLTAILEPYAIDAAALLRRLTQNRALLAQPTRTELHLPGGVECCLSRCDLDEGGHRRFLTPYELAEDEVFDLHYLSVGGKVYTFSDLWQGPWNALPQVQVQPAAA